MTKIKLENIDHRDRPKTKPVAAAVPDLIAVEIQAVDARLAKENVKPLPITDRRAGTVVPVGFGPSTEMG